MNIIYGRKIMLGFIGIGPFSKEKYLPYIGIFINKYRLGFKLK